MENFLLKEFFKAKKEWNFDEFEINENIDEFINQSKDVFEHTSFYPQSFRKSFLVQIFSIFEKELKEICLYPHFEKKN